MKNKKPLFILIPVALFAVIGIIVMLLWNYLMPVLFGLKTITYLQALGLFLLSKILFGNIGMVKRKGFANRPSGEKWMNMTREESEQFKQQWKARCNQ